jgi:DNA repair exonuclease SbcCD ATPase subunit
MRLILNGFRCHSQAVFTFQPGSLTLIKGPSGIGKSTLCQAILWCLYGHMNHVYNHTTQSNQTKCSVTLEFDNLPILGPGTWTVYRQKRPELFRITHQVNDVSTDSRHRQVDDASTDARHRQVNDVSTDSRHRQVDDASTDARHRQVYEDAVAQSIIESTFGPRDLWMSCCYLSQGHSCTLLMASQAEKMDLLNRLSFCSDDPDEFIRPIEAALTQVTTDFTALQETYTRECDQLTRDAATLVMDKFIPPDQRSGRQDELTKLHLDQRQLQQDLLNNQKLVGIQSSLLETQTALKRQLETVVVPTMAQIQALEHELETLTQIGPRYQQADKLRQELDRLMSQYSDNASVDPIDTTPVSERDIVEATLAQQHYHVGVTSCQTLGVEYTSEAIRAEITRLQQLLDAQPQLQIQTQIQTLRQAITRLDGPIVTDDHVLMAQDHLRKLQTSMNIMKCPHCQKPVRSMNQVLVPGEAEPASTTDIAAAKTQVDTLLQQRRNCQERQHLQDQLRQVETTSNQPGQTEIPTNCRLLAPLEVMAIRSRLQDLTKITVIPKPLHSPERLTRARNYQLALNRIREIQQELADLPTDRLDLGNSIQKLKTELTRCRDQRTRAETMQHQLNDVTDRLAKIVVDLTISQRLEEASQHITQITDQLAESRRIDECIARQAELEQKRERLLRLHQDMTKLHQLKALSLEVECHALQGTVDSINVALADITAALFDEPITITLQLFKTTKTTQRTKPTVNVTIAYKAGEYETITQLSGGEGDRISLALVLALARLNPFPLLLLDESMKFLDDTLRETCLRTIRQTLGTTKTVLSIAHGNVEGHYDDVISLDTPIGSSLGPTLTETS